MISVGFLLVLKIQLNRISVAIYRISVDAYDMSIGLPWIIMRCLEI